MTAIKREDSTYPVVTNPCELQLFISLVTIVIILPGTTMMTGEPIGHENTLMTETIVSLKIMVGTLIGSQSVNVTRHVGATTIADVHETGKTV